jgi:hypothetical protein
MYDTTSLGNQIQTFKVTVAVAQTSVFHSDGGGGGGGGGWKLCLILKIVL